MGAVQGPGHKFDFSKYMYTYLDRYLRYFSGTGMGTGQAGVCAGVCAAVVSRDHLDSSEDSE